MPIPPILVQATSGSDAAEVEVHRSAGSIGWHFRVGGQDVSVFTARLSAEGAGRTRVRVSYAPGEPLSPELGRLTSTALVRDLAEIAMSEQVDAQLEHRPFSQGDTIRAMARHAADHPEQVEEYGLAVKGMMEDIGRQAADAGQGSAGPAAAGVNQGDNQSAMDAATRPSVVLPVN